MTGMTPSWSVRGGRSTRIERIGKDIKRRSKTRLKKIDGKTGAKDMWTAVRQLTGRQHQQPVVDGVTAESLNDHYAAISTDSTPQATRQLHRASIHF